MAWEEHFGPSVYKTQWKGLSEHEFQKTRNKMRTAPLWGVRLRPRLMHDGASLTFLDAIRRHRGEAGQVTDRFLLLSHMDKEAFYEFLRSL